jgi:uncharacterized C2H2 Zn-finger protein
LGVKLSAKFARQESEEARLARIARKRIPADRIETVRRMLGLSPIEHQAEENHDAPQNLSCPECHRVFAFPMHLGRHVKASHARTTAEGSHGKMAI